MNINITLFNGIKDVLYNYDCEPAEIKHFLLGRESFLNRQDEAIEIIKNIMTVHGKKELLSYTAELARIEPVVRKLDPWARDHVVHALLSFLLGIYINKEVFSSECISVNEFQWKLAGLFHDVGYPIQIAKDVMLKPFAARINKIKHDLV